MKFNQPAPLNLEGWYEAFCIEASESKTKWGDPAIKLAFKITTADGEKQVYPPFRTIHRYREIQALCRACGVEWDPKDDLDIKGFENKRLCVLLEIDEQWGSQVRGYRESSEGQRVGPADVPF